jgi:hypothetical protein
MTDRIGHYVVAVVVVAGDVDGTDKQAKIGSLLHWNLIEENMISLCSCCIVIFIDLFLLCRE